MPRRLTSAFELIVGIISGSAPCAMIQCAIDCSRYCSTLFRKPSSRGGAWSRRADRPIFNGRDIFDLAAPAQALLAHYLGQQVLALEGTADPCRVVAQRADVVPHASAGVLGAQLDRMLLDLGKGLGNVLANRAVLAGLRVDE